MTCLPRSAKGKFTMHGNHNYILYFLSFPTLLNIDKPHKSLKSAYPAACLAGILHAILHMAKLGKLTRDTSEMYTVELHSSFSKTGPYVTCGKS